MTINSYFKLPYCLPIIKEIENKLSQGESFEDIVKSRLGGPFSILLEDLRNLHYFRFDEFDLLKNLQISDPDYLRTLYKMELVSTLRIKRFIKMMKNPYVSSRLEKLCNEGFYLIGVIFGSTGRFEATKRSDFEYTFLFYPSDRSRLGRKETAYLREVLDKEVKNYVEKEFSKWKEFEGSQICGINKRSISRSWAFTLKKKSTWTCSYFLSYCFFEHPSGLFKKMKTVYLSEVGIPKIVKNEYLEKINKKKLDSLLRGEIPKVPKYDMKKLAINTIQALALLKLKEETGHSLIDDTFKLWRQGELDKESTHNLLASILEVYKARWLYDIEQAYTVKNSTLLEGFRIAFEKVKEELPKE